MQLSSSFFLGIIAERQEHAEKIRRENKCVQWEHVCGDAGYFGKLVQNRLVTYYKNTTFRFNLHYLKYIKATFSNCRVCLTFRCSNRGEADETCTHLKDLYEHV